MNISTSIALFGTILVVLSAILTGLYQSVLARRIEEENAAIDEVTKDINFAQEKDTLVRNAFDTAQIMLALLQSTDPPEEARKHNLGEIVHKTLQGILERYIAATGSFPSDEHVAGWQSIGERAAIGDPSAFSELSSISAGLIEPYKNRVNAMVESRNEREIQKRKLKEKSDITRNMAVTLQVLGLVAVFMKDVFGPTK